MKQKLLLAFGGLVTQASISAATCTGLCYNGTYTSADIGSEVIDIMGAGGAFVYENIALIGILLLLGFIVGVFVAIKNKSGM